MNSSEIAVKVKTGLNKLDSQDYQNVEMWIIQQEYNKAAIDIVRETLRGNNPKREGKEQTLSIIEDLQVLLKSDVLSGINKDTYFKSQPFKKDYIQLSRVTPIVESSTCSNPVRFPSDLIEDSNVSEFLSHYDTSPSYDFEQSIHTLMGNRVYLYHNNQFKVRELDITYYREPKYLTFPNAPTPNGGVGKDEPSEFKKDFTELIIERTIENISSNIESINRMQIAQNAVQELK
jgi:hypothetical protein